MELRCSGTKPLQIWYSPLFSKQSASTESSLFSTCSYDVPFVVSRNLSILPLAHCSWVQGGEEYGLSSFWFIQNDTVGIQAVLESFLVASL